MIPNVIKVTYVCNEDVNNQDTENSAKELLNELGIDFETFNKYFDLADGWNHCLILDGEFPPQEAKVHFIYLEGDDIKTTWIYLPKQNKTIGISLT